MLRLPLDAIAEGERTLGDEAARYLLRVHRMGVGGRFVAFDPERRLEADAEIVSVRPRLCVALGQARAASEVAARAVTLVQAAARGAKLDAVVRDATELGATRVVVAVSARSLREASDRKRARWQRVAVEAARQAGRGDAPAVVGPLPLEEALALGDGRLVILHPRAAIGLAAALEGLQRDEPVTMAVGPEGGFSDEELDAAVAAGYRPARLGRWTLRTETACSAALGALAALSEQ
jgi:16S rRNA (uracil1498-N3)-methyltransferase